MQRLEVSGAVRPLYSSLGSKGFNILDSSLLGMKSVSYKICIENSKHISCSIAPLPPKIVGFF